MARLIKIQGSGRGQRSGNPSVPSVNDGSVTALRGFKVRSPLGRQFDSGTKAAVTAGSSNSRVTYTAKYPGAYGNNIKVQHAVSGANTAQAITVSYAATTGYPTILVTSATNGGSTATTTANAAVTAINADPIASQFVTASITAGNGTGVLATVSATNLTSGVDTGGAITAATLSTALTGANNDLVYTAKTVGTAGNLISVAYTNPAPTASASLTVTTSGNAITVSLATDAGTKASKVITSDNTDVTDGDTVTIGSIVYRFKDTMAQAYDVKRDGTTADNTMNNLIKAIKGTGTAGVEYYTGTVAHTLVTAGTLSAHAFTVTALTAGVAGNSIAIAETSSHLSWAGGATALSGGVDPIISTIASDISTAIAADTQANALVSLANKASNDGTGVVTALTATYLTGGSADTEPPYGVVGEPIYYKVTGGTTFVVDIDDGVTQRVLKRNNYRWVSLGSV